MVEKAIRALGEPRVPLALHLTLPPLEVGLGPTNAAQKIYDKGVVRRSLSVAAYTRAILSLIREHGFTQRMIARGLGVSEAYISRLVRDPAKLEEFVGRLRNHPALADFVRALEDREFRARLQMELAFPELREERNPTLIS
jgi:ParB-like chromosome segregation protein Spo0J